jgi:hypothetical protein
VTYAEFVEFSSRKTKGGWLVGGDVKPVLETAEYGTNSKAASYSKHSV